MKILIVSYFFPPSLSVGGLRAYSFNKYFPEEDIDTVILTSGSKKEVNQNFQKRTESVNLYYGKESKLREWGYKTKILPVLEFLQLDKLLFFPDIYFRWIKSAIRVGFQVIKNENPDAIYVTGPPFSSFIVAYKLSEATNIPLILEYRDPWLGNPFLIPPCKSFSKRIRKWERRIIAHSKLLITIGPECAEFIGGQTETNKDLFKIIHNGFFPEIPYKEILKKNDETFTISFFGSFYSLQKPIFMEFVEGLRRMIDENDLEPSEIVLQYAGGVSRSVLNRIITKGKIKSYFVDKGFLSKEQLNEEIKKSNLVFVTIPKGTEYMLQTKTYDYLGGNSHILLIGESSAITKLCIDTEQKFTEIKSDKNEIAINLSELYEKWKNRKLEYGCNREKLEKYNRKNLALKLAKVIKTTFKTDI